MNDRIEFREFPEPAPTSWATTCDDTTHIKVFTFTGPNNPPEITYMRHTPEAEAWIARLERFYSDPAKTTEGDQTNG